MMDLLEKIIAEKRKEINILKERTTYRDLEKTIDPGRETCSLARSLKDPARNGIIAEFKRMSPSRGMINSEAQPGHVAKGYSRAGASGLSILTDRNFFGGSIEDLKLARKVTTLPILRKEFIIDEIQVVESRAAGADAILLIAAVLGKEVIVKLARLSHALGMEVILEIHSPDELGLINEHVDIVGVNNRNLKTFVVNTGLSELMAKEIPDQFTRISESGISSHAMVSHLRKLGYHGYLIGELFMSGKDPVKEFIRFADKISREKSC